MQKSLFLYVLVAIVIAMVSAKEKAPRLRESGEKETIAKEEASLWGRLLSTDSSMSMIGGKKGDKRERRSRARLLNVV